MTKSYFFPFLNMTGKILYDFSNILDDRDSLDTSLLHQKAEKSISTGTAFYPFAMKPHIKQCKFIMLTGIVDCVLLANDKQQVLDQNWKNKYALKRPHTVADVNYI